MKQNLQKRLQQAAELVEQADGILIGAGAGMGVDSGLPDFRGNQGFWKAYPQLWELDLSFSEIATSRLFKTNPYSAWGFYGHRFNLYKSTLPHQGYAILKSWLTHKRLGGFIFTSNVDGHFQKAGFSESEVAECHGSINHWQCSKPCSNSGIWFNDIDQFYIDEQNLTVTSELPRCHECGDIARPNILMFNDQAWDAERSSEQIDLCYEWLRSVPRDKLIVLEIGAGPTVNTVREFCSGWGNKIRINPQGSSFSEGLCLPLPALQALVSIDKLIKRTQH